MPIKPMECPLEVVEQPHDTLEQTNEKPETEAEAKGKEKIEDIEESVHEVHSEAECTKQWQSVQEFQNACDNGWAVEVEADDPNAEEKIEILRDPVPNPLFYTGTDVMRKPLPEKIVYVREEQAEKEWFALAAGVILGASSVFYGWRLWAFVRGF